MGFRMVQNSKLAGRAALLYFRNRVATQSPVLDITFPVQQASLGLYGASADNARAMGCMSGHSLRLVSGYVKGSHSLV